MRGLGTLICLLTLASQAPASAPDHSPRPLARQAVAQAAPAPRPSVVVTAAPDGTLSRLRPEARPSAPAAAPAQDPRAVEEPAVTPDVSTAGSALVKAFAARSPQAIALSVRPLVRPKALVEKAMARRRERARGAVCGDLAIQGQEVGFVPGRIPACGIDNAVKLRSVAGVSLSQQALVDCTTARTLKRWIEEGLKPAVGSQGGGVAGLRVAAHYACRTRNNRPGGKVSEHGKGRAIDIAGVMLRDGSEISVLRDWGGGAKGRALKQMHRTACGRFGTVLGPGSDGYHRDHLHFDTARYRSGSYCR
ncbi:extensin family protein [Salipiger bermudensis]|uniref:extensin-like domain-containing protein n=1 Tax=Salipiger bermudensis TaxID=344736 RepID=UPI001CD1CB09|nr:extensin family protein [Salipiger bermudensis]MCA0962844.1 extensin family protein [Salipiger bermudensis]